MPLISPEQAAQMLGSRTIPPSDAPAPVVNGRAQAPEAVNVPAVLGHELPSDTTTPSGFPRADFAVAKPVVDKAKGAMSGAMASPKAPSTAIIREQPPLIGRQ
ncbi:hypothetical protein [Bradyrhizobium brasilense]|uniref:Uncharacterized protein n=1 Tax=Bradyrhizobium brasilense TaxID=1419277 RepID=A0ABY8JML8_9BRAD|nr:hypothetical protein [Bradyrhizobium brasilense]WFU66696.1 hypothetical protein QA636_14785 [Bradyrhizobium brasilense]